jgi:hypothetical protein
MPYFIIIPIWLVVLVLAGGLAFIPNTRRVATYFAVCATSGLVVSVAVSTLALILVSKLPWPASGSTVGGVALIASYIGGMILGGISGIALGFWGLYRFNGRRERSGLR